MGSTGDNSTNDGSEPAQLFTIAEAARACDVSVKTIRRYIGKGKIEAHRERESGGERWRMTYRSLVAAGLAPYGAQQSVNLREVDLRERLADAQRQLAVVTAQRDAAAAIAEERARSLERADQALSMFRAERG
jgi:predicted site-specific integrase-resolvase